MVLILSCKKRSRRSLISRDRSRIVPNLLILPSSYPGLRKQELVNQSPRPRPYRKMMFLVRRLRLFRVSQACTARRVLLARAWACLCVRVLFRQAALLVFWMMKVLRRSTESCPTSGCRHRVAFRCFDLSFKSFLTSPSMKERVGPRVSLPSEGIGGIFSSS